MSLWNANLLRKPSAEKLALAELEEAKRELLAAQTSSEFYAKQVEFNKMRIARLMSIVREAQSL